jgi:23S rRNA (cytidine1920-2'-O)/16S rRNA (cytidine1409-2'-O)-methyltransferase
VAENCPFVSRGGIKLDHALFTFKLEPRGQTCADFGCSTGGFTDCLLQYGAAKVYAVDTGYGVIDYKLRRDPRVVVMERTNAMHVELPEKVDLIVMDVGWTKQKHALPAAQRNLKTDGHVVSLIKPHYESEQSELRDGILPDEKIDDTIARVQAEIESTGFQVRQIIESPIKGQKGNREMLALLTPLCPL